MVAAIALIGLGAVLPLVADRGPAPRQIVVIARGMAFVVDGQTGANPVLALTAGERVEIVLRNETPGIVHDFAIPAWGVVVDPIRGGESATVAIEAPASPGTYEYLCRPHAQMMRGVVDVARP